MPVEIGGDLPYALSSATYADLMQTIGRVDTLPPRRQRPQVKRQGPATTPATWCKATSGSTSTVNLTGGGTLACYPAVWSYFDSNGGTWVDNDAVWLYPANGEVLTNGSRYLARQIGADTNTIGIFGTEAQASGGGGGYPTLTWHSYALSTTQTLTAGGGWGLLAGAAQINLSAGTWWIAATVTGSIQSGTGAVWAELTLVSSFWYGGASVASLPGVVVYSEASGIIYDTNSIQGIAVLSSTDTVKLNVQADAATGTPQIQGSGNGYVTNLIAVRIQ